MVQPGPYSQKNNQRKRRDFARIPTIIDIPNLIEIQEKSYERFLQATIHPRQREDAGLESVFRSVFPIKDFHESSWLEYIGYEAGVWECGCGEYKGLGGVGIMCDRCHGRVIYKQKYDVEECRQRGMTYADPLRILVRLVIAEKSDNGGAVAIREIREQKVYLGEIPLMTDKGTFLINGTERVIVSQMHRSPGVFFDHDKGKSHTGKVLYSARIIPYRGSWIDFEFDAKDMLYVRIDRKRKFSATVFLRALGLSTEDLLHTFYKTERVIYQWEKGEFSRTLSDLLLRERANDDIVDPKTGEIIVRANRRISKNALKRMELAQITEIPVKEEDLIGKIVAREVPNPTGETPLLSVNEEITPESLALIKEKKVSELSILYIDNNAPHDSALRDALASDNIDTQAEALIEIYRRLRPGDPPTLETAKLLFDSLFFDHKRYDLSRVGRLKLNSKLGINLPLEQRTLTTQDIVKVVEYLLNLRRGMGSIDDIDHLGNRRILSVGELLENQFRIGLIRMERAIRERMSIQDLESCMPHDLINSKPMTAAIKEFFGSSQLSQFMDQTNPLSEITHKRRLSTLGPGGLTRERAGFEVRDVHPSHYGRICPIETPEGPNIGLISSLSTYARINEFGFIEAPYRKVTRGRATHEVEFLSAMDEDKYVIAQANAELDEDGRFVQDLVSARKGGEFILVPVEEVDYMDVSPKQLVSVSASLIPFLENDDANRALMGSNMQRQAVPLLRTEAPLVGTGMEYIAARDSGAVVLARASGEVVSVDATRIVVRVDESANEEREARVDIYTLTKFQRSNQNTCINQRPIVKEGDHVEKGQVIADGPATDHGELALGRNVLVAFLPWGGYNFEDAIVVSEKLVKEDTFTSIHIEEFEVEARDTKQGKEEITRDIPNVGEEALKDLDESGIIRIGAKVKPGDILVGKITPKGETQLSPEEKLLKAIFGEKAGDVRDSSLTVPPGIDGTVVGVRVFSRKGVEKDSRMLTIEEEEINKIKRDFSDEIKIVKDERKKRIKHILKDTSIGNEDEEVEEIDLKETLSLPEDLDDLDSGELLDMIPGESEEVRERIQEIEETAGDHIHLLENMLNEKISRLKKGDELPPGVIKLVKIYVAMKRKLSVGDKMAGRHGNKGVVSKNVPEEDMPYLPDGTPVDIILNPLGVPSRMNVGQILETHLGWAADKLGIRVSTPVFDGATEEDIEKMLKEAGLPVSGKTVLYDGRTGEPFDQKVVVGHIYMMKLHHLVDDKIHARSTGPYSLVTQQPLGGKAQFGGQRLGEMEVWALEAYGSARTLQEMLTVKSDDVTGRTRMYEAIVKGENTLEASLPESFNVLVKELQSLGLDVELIENGDDGKNSS
ncbi:MAG: DNA-directed RNA polymerase subunit beta [Candidatus Tectomicrobia bacterium]|nr:DNA-directed RNA polymerase subunit beta [Candidatus Tectomicrobia bacterium]